MIVRPFGLLSSLLLPACAPYSSLPSAVPAASFERVTQLAPSIRTVHRDRAGRLWIGSYGQGLYRFDGTALIHYLRQSGLQGEDIRNIQEDAEGRLYFGTDAGVSRFDGQGFTTLEEHVAPAGESGWAKAPGDLWFPAGQDTGAVLRYDGTRLHRLAMPTTGLGEEFRARYPRAQYPNRKYSPYDVYTIYEDRRGDLWFGTSSLGACRYDGKEFQWIHEDDLGFDLGERSFGVRAILEEQDGTFWLTQTHHRYRIDAPLPSQTSRGGMRFAREEGLPHDPPRGEAPYTYVMAMVLDDAGKLWMSTYGAGVWSFDGQRLQHHSVEVDGQPIKLYSILRDRSGDLWVCTHEHGVCRFDGTRFVKLQF